MPLLTCQLINNADDSVLRPLVVEKVQGFERCRQFAKADLGMVLV